MRLLRRSPHRDLQRARRARRLPVVTLSTVVLVAAPTVLSGLPLGGGGHDRPGSVTTLKLAGLDKQGAREPGALTVESELESDSGAVLKPHASKPSEPKPSEPKPAEPNPSAPQVVTGEVSAVTDVVPLPGSVAVVGANWSAHATLSPGADLQVRTRSAAAWGPWQSLTTDAGHGPDESGPGAAEGARSRGGTEPFVVTAADAVQVRVVGGPPAPETQVEVVDPGERPQDTTAGTPRPDAAAAAARRPPIYSRKSWGADESLRRGQPAYGSIQAAFVHHTAGSNTYSAAQVPAIIRGIYKFHVQGRGWNDIGYNFLVDRFGRIWEGRYGGEQLPVVGAHTKGYNSDAFAMSAIGNFDTARPTSAMVSAYSRLFAWKMSLHGIPATGTVTLHGKRFQRISGHRDAGQTACPGRYLYAELPTIRAKTRSLLGASRDVSVNRELDGSTSDVIALPGGGEPTSVLAGAINPVAGFSRIGVRYTKMSLLVASPDLTGDGLPDMVARETATGVMRVYRGDGHGGFLSWTRHGRGWGVIRQLIAPGDLDRDGHNDLVAIDSDGLLRLYPGDGRGWLHSYRVIGHRWLKMSTVTGVGDLSGDGIPDLVGIRGTDGLLLRYRGIGDGRIHAPENIGHGWGIFDLAQGAGDLDGDGQVDLLVRERSGRMRTYYGQPGGVFSSRIFWGHGFNTLREMAGGVDWTGDGHPDLFGVRSNGDLRLYRGNGVREFDRSWASGLDLAGMDVAFVVGDLDGDGVSDVVAREASSGDLYLYPEPGAGDDPVTRKLIGKGFDAMDLLAPAGDMDLDGTPDLLARRADTGDLWLYPMTASAGFKQALVIGRQWGSVQDVVGVGTWDGDGASDLVARMSSGELRVYTGNGPGQLVSAYRLASSSNISRLFGAGDVNGDGVTDLLAQGTSGHVVAYFRSGNGLRGTRELATSADVMGRDFG